MIQQNTLNPSMFSANGLSLRLFILRATLDGCEVTTVTLVCCVVSFGCEMASLLPRSEGGSSLIGAGVVAG